MSEFTVLSLNLAHGRGRGWHQALTPRARIEANLDRVADLIVRESPDVVALQEADGESLWSGGFDHVEYLAAATELRHGFRGEHVRRMKLSYGTALLSRFPLADAASHTFRPAPPTPTKGLVVGTIGSTDTPADVGGLIDVASVHLDFARKRVRRRQADEVAQRVASRGRPLVLMGDFNCSFARRRFSRKPDAVQRLVEGLGLRAYRPEADGLGTFPLRRARLDWILVSADLEFVEYRTLDDPVSDHLPVLARLRVTAAAGTLAAAAE